MKRAFIPPSEPFAKTCSTAALPTQLWAAWLFRLAPSPGLRETSTLLFPSQTTAGLKVWWVSYALGIHARGFNRGKDPLAELDNLMHNRKNIAR